MKISEKQLPSKENFSIFLGLKCSNFRLKLCEGIRITKIVKEIKFEVVWGELEAEKCFQRQSFTKYLRLTLIFI